MSKALGLIIGGTVVAVIIGFVIWIFSVMNAETRLKLRGEAQQTVCEGFYSQMWQILKDKAGVTTEYAEQNKEFVKALMEGRYSKGDGSLMKWVTEQNPQFDASLYKDLMATIESQRTAFFVEQTKLIDIDREHKTLRSVFPGKWVIGDRPNIGGDKGIVILKNVATQKAYETGTEESMDLFDKKEKK